MHAVAGIHSAMAIKRQRHARELVAKKAKERRLSTQSSESGETRHSFHRKFRPHATTQKNTHEMLDSKVVASVGMLHIGVVFLVFGIFLVGAGVLPIGIAGIVNNEWWNELTGSGTFAMILGIFLISLNCLISKREEDDLEEYVQRQLTRSKSGHRLERDVETGGLMTRHNQRTKNLPETCLIHDHGYSQHHNHHIHDNEIPHTKSNGSLEDIDLATPTTPNGN